MSIGISRKKKIDSSRYVNIDTGESLNDEVAGKVSSVNIRSETLVKLKSEEFVITDTRTMEYLRGILSKSDLGYVRLMVEMVYSSWNILYSRSSMVPHTSRTLQSELDLANTAFYGLIQRLYKKGIIYYITGYNKRRKIKHIMLNPTIGRRTNQIERECLKYFENLSEKKSLL